MFFPTPTYFHERLNFNLSSPFHLRSKLANIPLIRKFQRLRYHPISDLPYLDCYLEVPDSLKSSNRCSDSSEFSN